MNHKENLLENLRREFAGKINRALMKNAIDYDIYHDIYFH